MYYIESGNINPIQLVFSYVLGLLTSFLFGYFYTFLTLIIPFVYFNIVITVVVAFNLGLICRVINEDASIQALYKKYGRRNIALNTTAPAGSVSILTQTTSGCEPVLFVSATRKRKINPSDKLSVVSEIDKMGDTKIGDTTIEDLIKSGQEKGGQFLRSVIEKILKFIGLKEERELLEKRIIERIRNEKTLK
jgi:hypothetical protein